MSNKTFKLAAQLLLILLCSATLSSALHASPTTADEQRSPPQQRRRDRSLPGVYKARIEPHWFANDSRFWYRNDLRGGTIEFVVVDTEAGTRQPAFDHMKLAESLSAATGHHYTADQLPFQTIEFVDGNKSIQFTIQDDKWTCDLNSYKCSTSSDQHGSGGTAGTDEKTKSAGSDKSPSDLSDSADDNPSASPSSDWPSPADDIAARDHKSPASPQQDQDSDDQDGRRSDRRKQEKESPDGKWTALVRENNIVIRSKTDSSQEIQLSKDGTASNSYGMLTWSPDSKSLVAFRIEPGDEKEVYLVESSPSGGGRAVLHKRPYPLAGDKFTSFELNLFNIEDRAQIKPGVDPIDFDYPVLHWFPDGRNFAYRKVDRGHQRLRVIRVDSQTGKATNLVDEKTNTFIWTAHTENLTLDLINWLKDSDELIYVSEKDGWRHLYLVDAKNGGIKNAITSGEYVIRGIDRIDEKNRQVWFNACGKNPDQDPYFLHYYRVNFDGTNLVALTEGNGNHSVQFSPDRKYLIDTYSRVDTPPVHELRRTSDGKLVCQLEKADISELEATGFKPLETFVAKGRDGKTDIWGVICRPKDFDPTKKYPVIESVYAGPQGAYVPKSFVGRGMFAALADLGFIVVQADGMGTANRSKAFHDVCWHNLKDAGFPDRIQWIKSAAEKYPYMDLNRVGIYGTSAGGQNSTGGMLFHPEFYKAAVSACGCHDNRMDKSSWNEQWMGYPVGPQYAESSNIDNAAKLQGKLLLIVGEMDDNVPPESTMRLVNALIKADKDFELLVVPGANHGMGGEYGVRRMRDFFVRNFLGADSGGKTSTAASSATQKPADAPEKASASAQVVPQTAEQNDHQTTTKQ